jgi:GT2 family glycosyltransferase
MKVATLITCYNRKEKTLACLEALFQITLAEGYSLDVYLVDDGSTDGTEQTVYERYPQITIIKGDGNLYWNGGMRVAFAAALEKGFDYYLWLNDDTLLYPSAIESMIKTSHQLSQLEGKAVVVVGATQDEASGKITYGGVIRPSKWRRTNFVLVSPKDEPVNCETMNGNCVLIPNNIAEKVGNLEPNFIHAMGDLDYGLRVGYAGFSVWVMPGFAGTCSNNPVTGSFNDARLFVTERFRRILQPKALPITSWRVFTQRHAGLLWPIFWLWPYTKVVLNGFFKK